MMPESKIRVLLADDEAHIRLMLKTVMMSMGAIVVGEAKNGAEAIEFYRREQPHIAFLDINMPIKTGIDALKEIKNEFPDALVMMMTSVADMETIEQCLEAGAANYILKDTPIQELKQMIKETWEELKS